MEMTYLKEPDPFVRRWLEETKMGRSRRSWNFSIRLISFTRRKERDIWPDHEKAAF
jgi:hypothetical protein